MRGLTTGCLLFVMASAGALAADRGQESEPLPFKIPGEQKMPEFADIAAWINSKPLKRADLRGKVVVVHFLTFG